MCRVICSQCSPCRRDRLSGRPSNSKSAHPNHPISNADMHLCVVFGLDRLDLPSLLCLLGSPLGPVSERPQVDALNSLRSQAVGSSLRSLRSLRPWPVSTAKRSSRAKVGSREAFPVRDLQGAASHRLLESVTDVGHGRTGSDNARNLSFHPQQPLARPASELCHRRRSQDLPPHARILAARREHSQRPYTPAGFFGLDPRHGRLPQNVQRCRLALLPKPRHDELLCGRDWPGWANCESLCVLWPSRILSFAVSRTSSFTKLVERCLTTLCS